MEPCWIRRDRSSESQSGGCDRVAAAPMKQLTGVVCLRTSSGMTVLSAASFLCSGNEWLD